ncbi:MAG: LCP family protein [Lachnospiraceae bacterium]
MKKLLTEKKRYLLWGASALLTVGLLLFAMSTTMIPVKYLMLAVLLLSVIYCGLWYMQKRAGKIRLFIAAFAEILMIVVSIYGMSVLYHATDMINEITETVMETETVSAYVRQEAEWQTLKEAASATFGVVNGQSEEAVHQVLCRVAEESGGVIIKPTGYIDMFVAADALRAGEIQVLVINEAYAGLIPEIEGYEWFATEVRILESSVEEVSVEKPAVSNTENGNVGNTTVPVTTPEGEQNEGSESPGGSSDVTNNNGVSSDKPETTPNPPVMGLMEPPEQVDWNALVNQEMLEVPEGTFIVYISGVDTWGTPKAKSRSDVNILAVVNTNTKKILLVSTPRDYYVPLSVSGGVKDKLTHAGIYGVESSVETLEMLYGVDIQYYVKMNFTGFVGIIDALGGVDVYSDSTFTVGDAFSYTEGINHMSGIEALAFARERHSFASGDRARGTHQMAVIRAVMDKCTSASILYNYADVMNSVSGCFTTNMSQEKIASLVRMQLNDMAQWSITSISVDGTGASKTTYTVPGKTAYVMIPDEATVQAAKEQISAVLAGE